MHTVCALLCFAVVKCWSVLPRFILGFSVTLGHSYNFLGALVQALRIWNISHGLVMNCYKLITTTYKAQQTMCLYYGNGRCNGQSRGQYIPEYETCTVHLSQIARFMWPTSDPPGSCRPQVSGRSHDGPMNLAIRDSNIHDSQFVVFCCG